MHRFRRYCGGGSHAEIVQTVKVFRDSSKPSGVLVEITGRLNALLGDKAYPNNVKGVWGSLVAEVRYSHSPIRLGRSSRYA